MKAIEISTASRPLADYASELDDFVVLTSDNKPVAAIVSLKNVDPESLALSTNAEFMEIVAKARTGVCRGQNGFASSHEKRIRPLSCLEQRRAMRWRSAAHYRRFPSG